MSYRENTRLPKVPIAFVYNCGGLGDFIHYTNAIRFAVDNYPHIEGYIVAPKFFYDLAKHWFYYARDRFEVVEQVPAEAIGHIPVGPNKFQIVGPSTFHLLQLGFILYNKFPEVPPGYETLPLIKGDEVSLDKFPLAQKYAVIPIMSTAPNRSMPSHVAGAVIDEFLSRGIQPVVLGKTEIAKNYNAHATVFDPQKVLDLRDKTSIMEAACILNHAEAVVGMDSGLMHLAACSERVPLLWMFSAVNPHYRIVKRKGHQIVLVPENTLECRFCETNMRYLPHATDSRMCLYKDFKCLTDIDNKEVLGALGELLDGTIRE